MSDNIVAFVLINVETGSEHDIHSSLQAIPEVKESYITFGSWDMVAKISTENLNKLESIVMEIRKIKGVGQTTTLVST